MRPRLPFCGGQSMTFARKNSGELNTLDVISDPRYVHPNIHGGIHLHGRGQRGLTMLEPNVSQPCSGFMQPSWQHLVRADHCPLMPHVFQLHVDVPNSRGPMLVLKWCISHADTTHSTEVAGLSSVQRLQATHMADHPLEHLHLTSAQRP